LRGADFDRLAIDPDTALARVERIRAAGPALAEKVRRVFARERPADDVDVDAALYGGFIGDGDKRLIAQVRGTPPHLLAKAQYAFRDARLPELLFRYRARNWPESLLPSERERWNAYRRQRLQADTGLSEASFEQLRLQCRGIVGGVSEGRRRRQPQSQFRQQLGAMTVWQVGIHQPQVVDAFQCERSTHRVGRIHLCRQCLQCGCHEAAADRIVFHQQQAWLHSLVI
jgi:exonuclease I